MSVLELERGARISFFGGRRGVLGSMRWSHGCSMYQWACRCGKIAGIWNVWEGVLKVMWRIEDYILEGSKKPLELTVEREDEKMRAEIFSKDLVVSYVRSCSGPCFLSLLPCSLLSDNSRGQDTASAPVPLFHCTLLLHSQPRPRH